MLLDELCKKSRFLGKTHNFLGSFLVIVTFLCAKNRWPGSDFANKIVGFFALSASTGAKFRKLPQIILHFCLHFCILHFLSRFYTFVFARLHFQSSHIKNRDCRFRVCLPQTGLSQQAVVCGSQNSFIKYIEKDRCPSHVPGEQRSSSVFCERVVIL